MKITDGKRFAIGILAATWLGVTSALHMSASDPKRT